ncbi:MAG TPA: efflux RND transporter periplasmic adaptor subunit [Vicinamibacterales bacterium]|jgi:HlyD family secretion protein|nr:efflux RND transporter periplasmic adaptor subunit [Vicinamibacterales bacterium]
MSKSNKRAVYATLAVLLLAGVGWGASARLGTSADIPESRLATIERGTMVRSVVATGKIEPITKVEIKSKANGIIEALPIDVDQHVEAGAVLVELDKDNLTAQVRQMRATLQAAKAAQQGAEAQLEKSRVEAEGPDVEYARRNLARAKSLFQQKLIAQSQLDDAQTALDQAENRQRAAQSQLSIAKAGVAETTANVAQALAAAERADEELANATIRAPIRGTILARDVEIGSPVSSILNMGSAATPVVTMGDISQVFVRGKVDETEIGHLKLGQPARITVETFKDRTFKGQVTQIAPMGVEKDNVTNFEVRVSIDNPGNELKANMTANAEIVLEERPNSLIVPEAAISYDVRRNPSVDVLDRAARTGRRRVPIKVGISSGTRTQVLEGLKEGDRVVLPN